MTDIAAKVGVSRATVSHVLTSSKGRNVRISEGTRLRILEAAAEMGYRPNQLARSVASGKIRMIGYLVDEPDYEPYWNTLIGALAEAEELGFALKVLSVKDETLAERVQQCVGFRLAGLIVRVNNDKSLIFEEANRAQMPVVVVDEGVSQPFGANVVADDAPGCKAAIAHLTGLGHTRIAFISSGFPQFNNGIEDIGSSRAQLFRREMGARGLPVPAGYVAYEVMSVFNRHVQRDDSVQSAIEAVRSLLEHPQGRPTAIVCWRDETAMVAVRVCKQQGLRVPEDISVVGFSDLSTARFFDPPLSTVKSPWNELGRMAMRQVVQRVSEEFSLDPSTHIVPSSFVIRESTGPVQE